MAAVFSSSVPGLMQGIVEAGYGVVQAGKELSAQVCGAAVVNDIQLRPHDYVYAIALFCLAGYDFEIAEVKIPETAGHGGGVVSNAKELQPLALPRLRHFPDGAVGMDTGNSMGMDIKQI